MEFFTRDADPDPRGRPAYEASVRCFADAAALMSPALTPVTIPFEGWPTSDQPSGDDAITALTTAGVRFGSSAPEPLASETVLLAA